jgi:serine/threonine-protein kinase
MSDDLIHSYLGPYHISKVIRHGGMSVVYQARQVSLGRNVAIKVLRHNSDPQFTARFKREAQTIAQLQHHNILPIYDYGEQNGVLYLVLQYIEGGTTLADVMGATMEPVAALRLMIHVLDALGYAHAHGVIHRDIKPSNILMSSPTWPMLADFGIAKPMDDNTQQRLTVPGLLVGTAAYMAPEQAIGNPIDARTDLYASGVMLYEMLTGRVPFDATTPIVVLTKHAYEAPPPPRSLNPDLPEAAEQVLLRALAKDPADRYQTAALMAADLSRLASDMEHSHVSGEIASLYQGGLQAFEKGRWAEAVDRLSRLVTLDPNFEDAAEMLEAARVAQEQARIAARQQLELARQRRQSTSQPQVVAAPAPPPEPPPGPAKVTTRETRRLSAAELAPPTPPPAPVALPEPEPSSEAAPAPTWRRYAPWAIGAVVLLVIAGVLLGSRAGGGGTTAGPRSAPTAAQPLADASAVAPTNQPATGATAAEPAATSEANAAATSGAPGSAATANQPAAETPETPAETEEPIRADPPETPAYSEDFSDQRSIAFESATDQNDDFQYGFHAPGAYVLRLKRQNDTGWVLEPRIALGDFVARTNAWDNSDDLSSGAAAQGLLFRAQDEQHFYAWLIDPRERRYTVRKRNGEEWSDIVAWTRSTLIKPNNAVNQMRVDADGDTFTLSLDGKTLATFTNADYSFGMLGLIAENMDASDPQMQFDDFVAWRIGDGAAPATSQRGDMVALPGGPFIMGSDKRDDSRPLHIVDLPPFLIDRTEVTNAAYQQCVEAAKCTAPAEAGSAKHPAYHTDSTFATYPVIHVTWQQATAYCAWAKKRLPTEAEWEKAASWNAATFEKSTWPWGDDPDPHRMNTDTRPEDTFAVGSFGAEINGTVDMAGNVWEWTSSLATPYPYDAADGREDAQASGARVIRGGSWAQSNGMRGAYRLPSDPQQQNRETGFRCAAAP